MHLLIVLALAVGTAGVLSALEATRRAVIGRRMERSLGALRSGSRSQGDLGLTSRTRRTTRPVPEAVTYRPREVRQAS
jgi:hypothetical protein